MEKYSAQSDGKAGYAAGNYKELGVAEQNGSE